MRFYHATRFLFPRRYELRLLLVCFLAVHVPLITVLMFEAVTMHWDLTILGVLLVATLAGTALGLSAIHALLTPVTRAIDLLEAVHAGRRVLDVPVGGQDLVGRLYLGVARAANENAARMERLVDAAERDPLTGLRNRRGFLDSAETLLDGATEAVLAIIDIDHFKQINDRFGHAEGDRVLEQFARHLENGIRRTDLAARWGGEEFIVLFVGASIAEAQAVLERLRTGLARDCVMPDPAWELTFSGGVARLAGFAGLGEATHQADAAMYAAKQAGRNRLQIAS
ncbi:GGDEF domain-containing protein [Novosphingobium colocasiae]|uniref:GGDEF domain-containing protein n=1 Tax=Novosphingobium colocasiae TaxID=1256513 RepID=UPI0035B174FD